MATPSRRLEMQAVLLRGVKLQIDGARRPAPSDKRALGQLMFAAYQGTADYSGESVEEAEREIEKTFMGSYGDFLPDCSYVVERNLTLVSASLITMLDQKPLLAFAMTSPSWKRQGLARAAIFNSMQDLLDAGATHLQMVVNPMNHCAVNLYESLGFRGKGSAA